MLLPELSRTYLAHHELESDIIVILLSAHVCVSLTMTTCAFADETISSRAAGMPYVSQYIQKYAEHIMQLPDDTGRAPSLNLDQLPIIKQIRR